MAAGMFEELADLATCSICFESFEKRTPRQLNCLHYFCEECLLTIANKDNTNTITCPICKQRTLIPGGLVTKLPLYFHMSRVQDITKQFKQRHSICHMCKSDRHKAEISFYCFNCASGHCKQCHAKHQKFYQKHAQIQATPLVIDHMICAEHDVHHEHFCMTCAKAVCSQCRIGAHSEHKVYDITYEHKEIEHEIKELLLSSLHSASHSLDNLSKLEAKVSHDIDNFVKEMTHQRDHLIKEINDQFDALCKELSEKRDDINNALIISKNLVEEVFTDIEELLTKLEQFDEPIEGVPEARIDQAQLMADFRKQISYADVKVHLKTVKFVSINDHVKLGKIVEKSLGSPVAAILSSLEGLTTEVSQILDSVSINPTLLWEKKMNVIDVDYFHNGQLVVCTSDGIRFFDDNGSTVPHYISNLTKSDVGQFCALSVSRELNKIAALQNRGWRTSYVHIFMQDGNDWQCKLFEVCTEPRFVSLMSSDGFVVYSTEDRKLHIYDQRGKESSQSNIISSEVFDLFVVTDSRIFVCCRFDVHIFDKTGQKMSLLSTKNLRLQPLSVYVEKNGQIFVGDGGCKSVLLFDQNYNFVRQLIDLDFSPNKIALYEQNRLSVYGQNRLCVYKL